MLLFAHFGPEVAQLVDEFVKTVGKMGVRSNADEPVKRTNETQPPNTLEKCNCDNGWFHRESYGRITGKSGEDAY